MRKILLILLVVFALGCIENANVDRIIDGDTFVADGERIRLTGIDTPERGEACYDKASSRLRELLTGEVNLERDIENRDKYNRLLRYVYSDDVFVNLVLVKEGYAYAFDYGKNHRYKDVIDEAESMAKLNGVGCLWS